MLKSGVLNKALIGHWQFVSVCYIFNTVGIRLVNLFVQETPVFVFLAFVVFKLIFYSFKKNNPPLVDLEKATDVHSVCVLEPSLTGRHD